MSEAAKPLTKENPSAADSVENLLQHEYKADEKMIARSGVFVAETLQAIIQARYEAAIQDLKAYQADKFYYPGFNDRTHRFFSHAIDLINAIKAKKNFPKMNQLPPSKRQELNNHLIGHFKDLKISLRRIVSIEQELRVKDSRSTIWVIQALFISGFSILLLAVVMEAFQTLRAPSEIFIEDVVKWLYKVLGI